MYIWESTILERYTSSPQAVTTLSENFQTYNGTEPVTYTISWSSNWQHPHIRVVVTCVFGFQLHYCSMLHDCHLWTSLLVFHKQRQWRVWEGRSQVAQLVSLVLLFLPKRPLQNIKSILHCTTYPPIFCSILIHSTCLLTFPASSPSPVPAHVPLLICVIPPSRPPSICLCWPTHFS